MNSSVQVPPGIPPYLHEIAAFAGQVADRCRRGERFLVCAHQRSDGDSLGSQLALVRLLQAAGARCRIVNRDPVPVSFHLLEGWEEIEVMESCPIGWGTVFCLDTSSIDWLGFSNTAQLETAVTFNLDHHLTNAGYGTHNLVAPSCSSTCELVYYLYRAMGRVIDIAAARCLFAGMMTDSGDFSFRQAGPATFRAAANLMERGVDHWELHRALFMSRPLEWLRLMGVVLSRAELHGDGTIIYSRITLELLAEVGVGREHAHGIINRLTEVAGVEVAVTFEVRGSAVHVEMRAAGGVDVSAVALPLGGGGHASAAGCTLEGPVSQVERTIIEALERHIAAAGPTA